METNEVERRRWNEDGVAEEWPKRERLTDAVTPVLLAAAAPAAGERVLDVGCGGGRTAIAAARAVGAHGAVVGADLSAPLCALAERRAREAGIEHVAFRVVDMQIDEVDGGPFDLALSQFGVMFFDEPLTAFRNIRSHLVAGGRLAFACWQSMEHNRWFFGAALAGFVPAPPAPAPGKSATGPFSLADAERTASLLRSAGYADVRVTTHELDVDTPPDTVFDDGLLTAFGVPADRLDAAKAAVEAHLREFALRPGLSRFPIAFQVVEATSP